MWLPAPTSTEGVSPLRGLRWHAPLRIILRYVPLIIRCHFLHFETMNECKPCTKLRQSSALACLKLLQAIVDAWIKMAEKPQKNGKESC